LQIPLWRLNLRTATFRTKAVYLPFDTAVSKFRPMRIFALALMFGVASLQLPVQAALELRSPIGGALAYPDKLNSVTDPSLKVNFTLSYGADLLFDLPAYDDYSIGLRFDSISAVRQDDTKEGHKLEIAARLFSLVGRKVWRSESFYWGPVTAIGLYLPSDINIRSASGDWTRYESQKPFSMSAGAEAGWVRDIYIISLEGGLHLLHLDQLKSSQNGDLTDSSGASIGANLTGPYVKLILGLRL
jgi:hypothetical protein